MPLQFLCLTCPATLTSKPNGLFLTLTAVLSPRAAVRSVQILTTVYSVLVPPTQRDLFLPHAEEAIWGINKE